MEAILEKLPIILEVIGGLVLVATAAVGLTKSKKDDEVVTKVGKVWQKVRPFLATVSLKKK